MRIRDSRAEPYFAPRPLPPSRQCHRAAHPAGRRGLLRVRRAQVVLRVLAPGADDRPHAAAARPGSVKGPPRPARPDGARSLARYPNVYDAAFSWDRSREARTFLHVAASLRGTPVRSAAELACGTGPLARLWATWGVASYGIDRSAPAIARARRLSRGTIPPDHWGVADLRSFRLPRRVDLAAVPLDGLGYLVDVPGILRFFRAARRCLAPRGVLAVDLTLHPDAGPPLRIRNRWNVSLRPQGDLQVSWRSQGRPWGSPIRQWEAGRVTVRVPGQRAQIFWEARPHAALSVRILRDLAASAGGFGEPHIYSDAAHRASPGRLRRVPLEGRLYGPRLVGWRRS
jgi:SAM-dependent methyltransferase